MSRSQSKTNQMNNRQQNKKSRTQQSPPTTPLWIFRSLINSWKAQPSLATQICQTT